MKRLALVCVLAACGDPPKKSADAAVAIDAAADSAIDAPPVSADPEVALIPTVANLDVDILFLVDDSPSMIDKQQNLKAAFPTFASSLSALAGKLPNLHIGVVTSDLGTKGAGDAQPGPGIGSGPGACNGTGKGGNLQNSSTTVADKYISDVDSGTGPRVTNYTGTLSDAFSSLASVGAAGCGFEQQIEATHLALANNPANAGFLRPSANLAIIYLTDEDDCSIEHSTILGTDTTTFGPLQSFRCTRFGITCTTGGATSDDMNTVGPKSGCTSNDAGTYLTHVSDAIAFFQTLKPDPRDIMIGAIAGDPTPFSVELRAPGGGGTAVPALTHSCTYSGQNGTEVADPAVRVQQLASAFRRHSFSSVCTNVSTAMDDIAHQIAGMTGVPCLTRAIAQPAMCHVYDERAGTAPAEIPACTGANQPCYTITADATACPDMQHLRVDVTRASPAPADTMVSVHCAL